MRRRLARSLHARGFWGTAWVGLRFIVVLGLHLSPTRWRARRIGLEFDREHNVDTEGTIPLSELSIESSSWIHGVNYQPIGFGIFDALMRALPIRHQDFLFLDVGAGKGRPLFLAASHPFRRILGVEFAPELHALCAENIRRFRSPSQKCFDLRVELGDAISFSFPPVPTLFFLYNPFGSAVLRPFIENLRRSLRQYPRHVFVAYLNPVHADLFDHAGFLDRVAQQETFIVWTTLSGAGEVAAAP